MNRKKRTEILIKSNENVAKMLADSVREKYEIKVIEGVAFHWRKNLKEY